MEKEITLETIMENIRKEFNYVSPITISNQDYSLDEQFLNGSGIMNKDGIDAIMEKIRQEVFLRHQVFAENNYSPSVASEPSDKNFVLDHPIKQQSQINEQRYNPTIERIGINFRARVQRYRFIVFIYDNLAKGVKYILRLSKILN